MISSELRPNVLVEFVINVSITSSSTPAWASLMTSAKGLEALMLGGNGFSSRAAGAGSGFSAGAAVVSGIAAAGEALAPATAGTAGSAAATAIKPWDDVADCWSHPASNGIMANSSHKLPRSKDCVFMLFEFRNIRHCTLAVSYLRDSPEAAGIHASDADGRWVATSVLDRRLAWYATPNRTGINGLGNHSKRQQERTKGGAFDMSRVEERSEVSGCRPSTCQRFCGSVPCSRVILPP